MLKRGPNMRGKHPNVESTKEVTRVGLDQACRSYPMINLHSASA